MSPLHAKVNAVKNAVISIATCTPSTVTNLSALLLPESQNDPATTAATTKSAGRTAKPAQSRTKASVKSATNGAAKTVQEEQKIVKAQLSQKERAILATEVVNLTLKALDNAIKAPLTKRQPSKDPVKNTARQALRRSISLPQNSPQRGSLERVPSSPSLSNRSSRSSSSSSLPSLSSGQKAIAECSRIAFACLRALQASKSSYVDLPPLRLENGMSALIGKLIALGLDDLALKELRILKRRLDVSTKSQKQVTSRKPVNSATSKATATGMSQSLADLLGFANLPESGPMVTLAIATQIQVLKLMTTCKRPAIIADALPKMDLHHDGSPFSLIVRSAKVSTDRGAKAAKQLETVSLLLLSLSPSISSSEDALATMSDMFPSPQTALQLQTLAYRARTMWWKLAGHQPDVEKELFEPFSRCLAAFARRNQGLANASYELSVKAFQHFQEFVAKPTTISTSKSKSATSIVYKILSSFAQEAGKYEDAVEWTEKLREIYRCGASDVQQCSVMARLASFKLRLNSNIDEAEILLVKVSEGMQGPLKGESKELDELLLDVSRVRASAISLLTKRHSASQDLSIPEGVRSACETLVLLCPRFAMRYLGKYPSQNSAKEVINYEQRRRFLSALVLPMIDSALNLVRLLRKDGRLTWESMDSTLQQSLALYEATITSDSYTASPSYHVRISHLYYSYYLDLQLAVNGSKNVERVRILRRSIQCVQECSAEDRKAAILTVKLQRLASIYSSIGLVQESKDTLRILQGELVGRGALATAAAALSSKSLKASWDSSDDSASLARAVSLLARLESKMSHVGEKSAFLDENWSINEKGAMLEHVLDSLSTQLNNTTLVQKSVLQDLLSIYDSKSYPIRRLRVLIHALKYDIDQRLESRDDVRNTIALASIDAVIDESEDFQLRPYVTHLKALASSILELQEDHPRVELIRRHLATWNSLLADVKDADNLNVKVDDVSQLLLHLHCISDYLDLRGFSQTRLAVLRMIADLHDFQTSASSPDDPLLSYVSLGLQYLTLGYSGKAGLALDRAHSQFSRNGLSDRARLRYYLAYSEYLMAIGNISKCEETLNLARGYSEELGAPAGERRVGSVEKLHRSLFLTDASLLSSRLHMEQGSFPIALSHARRSVRLMRRAWNLVEMQTKAQNENGKLTAEEQTQDESELNMSTNMTLNLSQSEDRLPGPAFWSMISPLFRSLSHLSHVYAHQGMFQESMYYAEQAHGVVKRIGASTHAADGAALLGNIWLNAGVLDKASQFLAQANDISTSTGKSTTSVTISSSLGKLYGLHGNQKEEIAAYEDALAALQSLTDVKYIADLDKIVDPASILEAEMTRLSLAPRKAPMARRAATRSKPVARKITARTKVAEIEESTVSDEYPQLKALRGLVLRHKARAMLVQRRFEEVMTLLKESGAYVFGQGDDIQQHIAVARRFVHQGLIQMATDPVYSVLQDSTISYPSIMSTAKGGSTGSDRHSSVRLSPPQKRQTSTRAKSPSGTGFFDKLRQAQEHLFEAHSLAVQIASTAVLQNISALLNTTMILLSAAGNAKGKITASLGFATCSAELVRTVALVRERAAVARDEGDASLDDFIWPVLSTKEQRYTKSIVSDLHAFQKDYIDIIPSNWTAISVSLSETRQELCLTKLQAGNSPFVLRLPLGRNNSRDADEEVFDYEQGHAELLEIIDLANASSHGARSINGRGAKTAWWAEREELDARLKDLLENIEKVWLGGFSGIFSQHARQPQLLARFQRSFQDILDKHLPSRRKAGKKTKSHRVALDTRILELFVGLGDPSDGVDLDEAMMDLLYFVVDILQFHGEHNAYDEIDLDAMVVETQDALRCYHEAVSDIHGTNEDSHTILILDKALHAFPWESLPCLDGAAVSRLPSLGCLRDRLLAQQAEAHSRDIQGHYIDQSNGTYILNPSNDLKSTQATFSKSLQNLSTWLGIQSRIPTEEEFEDSLSSKDLVLYFGHGSGAQYIRPKVVKRLDRCAVTMLMGCSSGALTDAGEFEPYGTPVNYMLAGCPALVATLWDVTDKDIDRFALRTFEEWGLFREHDAPKTGRDKAKAAATAVSSSSSSLVQAVARGRHACHLKYLTAAAVVVYGIPVYFK